MLSRKERDKKFLYCLEELRLLIDKPYEHDALIDRLATVVNNLEQLYEQSLLKER